jgi:hypothetical protein
MENFKVIEKTYKKYNKTKTKYYIQYQKNGRWRYLKEYKNFFKCGGRNLWWVLFIPLLGQIMFFIWIKSFFLKETFDTEAGAIDYIKDLKNHKKERIKRKNFKKSIETKTIGVILNGEYINKEKLERWKKLERIVNDETI